MSKFPSRLKEIRESLGMDKTTFASYLGVSLPNITRYENESMGVAMSSVEEIGKKLGISPAWLLGWTENKYLEKDANFRIVPLLGNISAGQPILAEENIEGYEYINEEINADFCLKVKGDSMINARILDGDTVYIRQQADVENGEIAAVLIDNETTLKRVYKLDGLIMLRPENPAYKEMVISKKDYKNIKILGKVIFFKSKVR